MRGAHPPGWHRIAGVGGTEDRGAGEAPGLVGTLWTMLRGLDRDRPQMMRSTPESDAVLRRAQELASEGREDGAAVAELRALAGGRSALRLAERASRFDGLHRELRFANRVHRLLRAASAGRAVEAAGPQDLRRIEAIERFDALDEDERWARLVELEPRVGPLVDEARALPAPPSATKERDDSERREVATSFDAAGRPTRLVRVTVSGFERSEQERAAVEAFGRAWFALNTRLRTLVGPDCGSDDPVLGSAWVRRYAERHLDRLARGAGPV